MENFDVGNRFFFLVGGVRKDSDIVLWGMTRHSLNQAARLCTSRDEVSGFSKSEYGRRVAKI